MEDFLNDPTVVLLGYQVHFRQMSSGFFLFNHMRCRSTMGLDAGLFTHMSDVPLFNECQLRDTRCPEYCLRSGLSEEPPELCDCSYVQGIVHRIQKWPKKRG